MRILIYGCNQLTGALAPSLAHGSHQVTVIDPDWDSLARLQRQAAVAVIHVADPLLQEYMTEGDVDNAEAFLALASDDYINILLSQVAARIYNVERVLCQIADPKLQTFYRNLGVNVLPATADALGEIQAFLER